MSNLKLMSLAIPCALLALSGLSHAKSTTTTPTWVTMVSTGPAWTHGGKSQRFFLAPGIEKHFADDSSINVFPNFALFFGYQKPVRETVNGQLGVELAATGHTNLTGEIWDDALPAFNNHRYDYAVSHTHIGIKGRLLKNTKQRAMQIYAQGGVGLAFNRAKNFSSRPLIFAALSPPNFSDNTTTALTYSVGAGVQKSLSKHWQLGLGYEFSDWGKSQLGASSGQTLNSGLKLNHLYSSSVLASVAYTQ